MNTKWSFNVKNIRGEENVCRTTSLSLVLVKERKFADASVYMSVFVMYAQIVHVQCYSGWNVKMGYMNAIYRIL